VAAIWRKINPNGGIDTGPESGQDTKAPRGCYKSSRDTQEEQNRLGASRQQLWRAGSAFHLSLGVVYPGKDANSKWVDGIIFQIQMNR